MVERIETGVLAPGRWRWLRALGWMLVLIAAMALVLSIQGIVHATWHPGAGVTASLAGFETVLAYLLYARLVRVGERRRVAELALRPLPSEFAIGLAIGLGMFTLVIAGLRIAGLYTLTRGQWVDWPHDVYEALGAGFLEELLFRLVLLRLLLQAFGRWPALLASAAFFGAAHLANPHATIEAALAIAVEAGLMLGAFYLLTGRIWMSIGVHAAWNFAQGSIFGASVSGHAETGSLFVGAPVAGASPLASGGAFGPEASLLAMLVGAAVFALVMWRLPREPAGAGAA